MKIMIKQVGVVLICTVLLFVSAGCRRVSSNLSLYQTFLEEVATPLPALDSLPEYENVRFQRYHDSALWFTWDAYTLIVQYNEETYLQEKENVARIFQFATEPILNETSEPDYPRTVDPVFSLDGFDFRLLSVEVYADQYGLDYPKYMVFIGTSDATREIAYIHYLNQDLDCLSTDFAGFLAEDCGWKRWEQ